MKKTGRDVLLENVLRLAKAQNSLVGRQFTAPLRPVHRVVVTQMHLTLRSIINNDPAPAVLYQWEIESPVTARLVQPTDKEEFGRFAQQTQRIIIHWLGTDLDHWSPAFPHFPHALETVDFQLLFPFGKPRRGIAPLDVLEARYDGQNLYYVANWRRYKYRDALREAQARIAALEPDLEGISNTTNELAAAYGMLVNIRQAEFEARRRAERAELMARLDYRIQEAVEKGGGDYHSHQDRGENIVVRYFVDNEEYRALVDPNLRVIGGGICLAGRDRLYDLATLVNTVARTTGRYNHYRVEV